MAIQVSQLQTSADNNLLQDGSARSVGITIAGLMVVTLVLARAAYVQQKSN